MRKRWLRDDPHFFPKERAALGLRTSADFDYDSSREAARRLAQDKAVRRALVLGCALLGLACTRFGGLHSQMQWQAVVPLALFAAALPWCEPWWRGADQQGRQGYGTAFLVAAALITLPSLHGLEQAWVSVPIVCAVSALAIAWPFGGSLAAPSAFRAAATIVLQAAILLWPMVGVLSGETLTGAAAAALTAAAASFFAIAGGARCAEITHPELLLRLSISALAAALCGLPRTPEAWALGLAASVAVALLLRLKRGALFGREAPWNLLIAMVALDAWSMAFSREALAELIAWQVGAAAIAFSAVAFATARRWRHWLESRPARLARVNPQVVVPLLDRSQHHPVESWRA